MESSKLLRKIRLMLAFFVTMLVLSGVTAFPAETLLHWVLQYRAMLPQFLIDFLTIVYNGLHETNLKYPFLAYGYDWLAFAHIVIGTAFIGPWREPVRNIWVIEWAMLACVLVIPLAMICAPLRDVPFFWRLIDCSFGVFGIIPLWIVRRWILQLERMESLH
jgi:hypothetical protein